MKKIIGIFALSALFFAGCKDTGDKNGTPPPSSKYPTANLKVDDVMRMLVLQVTGAWCENCPQATENTTIAKARYGDRVLHLSMHMFDGLQTDASLTFTESFDTTQFPTFYINNQNVDLDLLVNFEPVMMNHPARATLNQAILDTDSGFVVYPLIRFDKEIRNSKLYVQSYLTLDAVEARDYGGVNLNQTSSGGKLTGSNPTTWANDAAAVDDDYLIAKGTPYYHTNVLFKAADTQHPWGFDLDKVHPFAGGAFFEEDLFGTEFTPIALRIEKPTISNIPFNNFSFTTIVWELTSEGKYDFVGGFRSKL